jgi:hypothetical protein
MTSLCIVYLASPRDSHAYETIPSMRVSRKDMLRGSIRIVKRLFPDTPMYVFHEDYTSEDMASFPEGTEFLTVDFTGKEGVVNPGLRRPYGYLMMCRFFSGILQSHPAVQRHTHYMRLDDDSYFLEPWISPNRLRLEHDYIYRSLFLDKIGQQSLFDFTMAFLRKEGLERHFPALKTHLKANWFFLADGTYSGVAPYNNFHIASLRLWNNPIVKRYIQAIEDCDGILRYGWMDANIHSMVVFVLSVFCGMTSYHDSTFGYRHNQHLSRLDSVEVLYDASLPFGPEETTETT